MSEHDHMEGASAPKPAGMSRGLRWLLIGSLALNLLIVGLAGGAMLSWGKGGRPHPARLDQIGGPLTRALTHHDRHAIGRELRRAARAQTDQRGAHKAIFRAMIAELRKESFDAEAVQALMARQRAFLTDRLSNGQTLLAAASGRDEPSRAHRLCRPA